MTLSELTEILSIENPDELKSLFERARKTKLEYSGKGVFLRGLLEISNICKKDCFYCGIRKSNSKTKRYRMTMDEIRFAARFAHEHRLGSMVLQSGEIESEAFTRFVEEALFVIDEVSGGKLGVTLSCGEQSAEVYRRWRKAGAKRYLLRIESSDEALYKKWHPESCSHPRRMDCITMLRNENFQVGTGVLIGAPFQTAEHLAKDLKFFEKMDIDMIGMGPYVLHSETPMGKSAENTQSAQNRRLNLALKMIAAARILLKDVNIASTTALDALSPSGKELGISAGANVLMPNLTPMKYREEYFLYEGKPVIDATDENSLKALEKRIESAGEEIGWGIHGDSRHFQKRKI